MKVLIIEDEPLAAKRLERMILKEAEDFVVTGRTESIAESISFLEENKVDLIFADIHLSDGHSFTIFETINPNVPIIFTTAYDQYAIKAFQWNSIDYLLKPIEKEALSKSVNKLRASLKPLSPIDLEALTSAITEKKKTYKSRLVVQVGDNLKLVHIEDIAYFKGEGKYVYVFTHEGKKFIVDHTLTELETILKPELFFRVNRQFIISINAIKNMFTQSKGRVMVELEPKTDIVVIVSVERSPNFKKWLNG